MMSFAPISSCLIFQSGASFTFQTSTKWLLVIYDSNRYDRYFFENSAGEYSNLNDVEKNKLLVQRVESIVSAETSKYFTIHQPEKLKEK